MSPQKHYYDFQLSLKEAIFLICLTPLQPPHVRDLLRSIQEDRCRLLYPLLFLSSFILSVPVVAAQIFWGSYTGSSFIKFWDILPAARGIGYMQIMHLAIQSAYSVAHLCIQLIMLKSSFTLPWMNCDNVDKNQHCYPISSKVNGTEECSHNTIFPLSSVVYLKSYYPFEIIEELSSAPGTTMNFVAFYAVVWIVVFLVSVIEFKKLMVFIKITTIASLIFLAPFFCFALIFTNFSDTKNLEDFGCAKYSSPSPVFSVLMFANKVCNYVTFIDRPGIYLYIASRLHLEVEPYYVALITNLFKFTFMGLFAMCFLTVMSYIQSTTGLDMVCLSCKSTHMFMYALFPSFLTYLHAKNMLILLWFAMLICWELVSVIIIIHSTVYSLCQLHTIMPTDFQFVLPMAYCIVCFFVGLLLLNYEASEIYEIYKNTVTGSSTSIMFIALGLALMTYAPRQFANDYKFKFGTKARMVWLSQLEISLAVNFMKFIVDWGITFFYLHWRPYFSGVTRRRYILYILCGIYFSPVLLAFVYEYFKLGSLARVFQTKPDWGPKAENERIEREQFSADIVERYKVNDTRFLCKHNCLIDAETFISEREMYIKKLEKFRILFSSYKSENRTDE